MHILKRQLCCRTIYMQCGPAPLSNSVLVQQGSRVQQGVLCQVLCGSCVPGDRELWMGYCSFPPSFSDTFCDKSTHTFTLSLSLSYTHTHTHLHTHTRTTRRLLFYVPVHFQMFVFQLCFFFLTGAAELHSTLCNSICTLSFLRLPQSPHLFFFCLYCLRHCHTVYHI